MDETEPRRAVVVDMQMFADYVRAYNALHGLHGLADLVRILLEQCELTPRHAHLAEYVRGWADRAIPAFTAKVLEMPPILSEMLSPEDPLMLGTVRTANASRELPPSIASWDFITEEDVPPPGAPYAVRRGAIEVIHFPAPPRAGGVKS